MYECVRYLDDQKKEQNDGNIICSFFLCHVYSLLYLDPADLSDSQ